MPTSHGGVPVPKPEPRQRAKARGKRREAAIIQQVRAACVERDGDCRIVAAAWNPLGPCSGESEWAHLWSKKRFQTRGMEPDQRHSTVWTCQLCTKHHGMEERHELQIEPIDPVLGCDGVLRIRQGQVSVLSVPRTR